MAVAESLPQPLLPEAASHAHDSTSLQEHLAAKEVFDLGIIARAGNPSNLVRNIAYRRYKMAKSNLSPTERGKYADLLRWRKEKLWRATAEPLMDLREQEARIEKLKRDEEDAMDTLRKEAEDAAGNLVETRDKGDKRVGD